MENARSGVEGRDGIPECVALAEKHVITSLAAQVEHYVDCPPAEFKLSAQTHHWIIVQHDRGPGKMLIETDGQEHGAHDLQQNKLIYIPPFTRTEWKFESVSGCTHILLPDSLILQASGGHRELDFLHTKGARVGESANKLCSQLGALAARSDFDSPAKKSSVLELELEQYVINAAEGLMDHVRTIEGKGDPVCNPVTGLLLSKFDEIKDYMWENLSQSILLQELASVAGMSVFYFSRCFKNITGMPPHKYLMCMRIQKARTLLPRERNLAIIACICGFADQAHFTRVFKAFTGVTPHQFSLATCP